MRSRLPWLAAACLAFALPAALAQPKGEIRIAHVYSKTGALEAYGKQTQTGFTMGLNYGWDKIRFPSPAATNRIDS